MYKFDEASRTVDIEDADSCMFCQECVRMAEQMGYPNLVSIREKDQVYRFTVEVRVK